MLSNMQNRVLRNRLFEVKDITSDALEEIFRIARSPNIKLESAGLHINLFFENSTRTLISFEKAALELGFSVVNFNSSTSSMSKDETEINTIRTLNSMNPKAVVLRCKQSGESALLAKYLSPHIAVINAGDGANEHPTQALLDLYTILQAFNINYSSGALKGFRIAIVGDIMNSRVARSNIFLLSRLGAEIFLVSPPNFLPYNLSSYYATHFNCRSLRGAQEALSLPVDIIMMLRVQKERMEGSGMIVFPSLGYSLKNDMDLGEIKIMHPGPINENIEITPELAYISSNSLISTQVENGVLVRAAVLNFLSRS